MRTAVLFALVAVLVSVAWLRLEESRAPLVDIGRIVGIALLPALAYRWGARSRRLLVVLPALGAATLFAASASFHASLVDARPRNPERDFFGPVLAQVRDGFRDYYETQVPFDRLSHPQMEGVLLLAIFGFLAVVFLLLAARRPLAAGGALVVGIGWPATLIVGGRPLGMGALALAGVLALLFLARGGRRPLQGIGAALTLGVVLVGLAVGASTSSAVAKRAIFSWQRWDLYDAPEKPVGVRYVWSFNYDGLRFPEKKTVVLKVRGPSRSLYWRATTLDEFNGVGWIESLEPGPPAVVNEIEDALADPLLPEKARDEKNWVRQDVTVGSLAETHLIAATQPVKWNPRTDAPVRYAPGGVVLLPRGLAKNHRYTVWSYTPEVKPEILVRTKPLYPRALNRYLAVLPGVRFPAFGIPDRNRVIEALFAERASDILLQEYHPLYRRAVDLAGETFSPYAAAVGLEKWFRQEGGFTYDEQPPPPLGSEPPLLDFVLNGKRGYCQQYAGAMALMLRMLGIPARVAAGFVSGKYDSGRREWTVTNHDAHAWVEVYFPGHGWLPFDPTPGRGQLGSPYSASSQGFDLGSGGVNLGAFSAGGLGAIFAEELRRRGLENGDPSLRADRGADLGVSGDEGRGGGAGIVGLVFAILAGAVALLLGAKALRRSLRFLTNDPRRVAAACRRDLAGFLSDQRIDLGPSTTLGEVGALLERAYLIDAKPFVRAVAAARFGQPLWAQDEARRARRELRALLRQLRRELGVPARVRGALSARSLGV